MPSTPDASVSRREALAAVGGLAVGAAGGYVVGARPDRTETSPEPLVYGPTEWPMTDYDAAHTRHVPATSRPDGNLREDWRVEYTAEADYDSVVGNGAVYTLVSDEPDTGVVRAVRLADGREVWRTTPTDDAHNRGGLAALGDSVFLGTTGERT
ncbi:hypothetical protein [Halospeciosus flavus]|uniref:Uncharacterized protein n=1 Tax=Halospeciosus flavus TaxID=3032283 RepID=A0ABD5Z8C0_9EURY|nr:hypothetical protein [Halospeciosus flavus]